MLIIIFVNGCCIFVLILLDINIGIKFKVDVIVVISIGFNFEVVFLKMVLDVFRLFLICWLIFFIIMILFNIVILNKVIKLMEFGIDKYCLDKYKEKILLIIVSGMLINISIVWLIELKVK